MATSCSSKIAREIGGAVKNGGGWYGPHMAAASRAIAQRIPLVDLVLEIRDARIPFSSENQQLSNLPFSSNRRIIVLNKMDLVNPSQLKDWMSYFNFNQPKCISLAVNSHNKNSVKEFLNFLQARVRELRRNSTHAITVMLVGIPNVGKTALVKSLHHIGRISAAEKGKLKHTTVSPQPGGTKDINSFKIASHPNIYVLDTPGILPSEIHDVELCSKLALTGAIRDGLVGQKELAEYFLAILNFSDEYKKWAKFPPYETDKSFLQSKAEHSAGLELQMRQRQQYPNDHTQDFMVQKIRQTLCEVISRFDGQVEHEKDLVKLIKLQFSALREAFQVPVDFGENAYSKVASKMLNLYRTGRLGRYILDTLPTSEDYSKD